MFEQRKNIRYKSMARVRIPALLEEDAILKDLSLTGCRIETTEKFSADPGTEYTIRVIPEHTTKIHPFDIHVETRWVDMENGIYEAGFTIKIYPEGKHFDHYVDYLSWHR